MQAHFAPSAPTSSRTVNIRAKSRSTLASLFIGIILAFSGGEEARADDTPINFFDPEDGQLDLSDFLLNHRGALVVPTIITEPAVGNGFGLALAFFSESISDAAVEAKKTGKKWLHRISPYSAVPRQKTEHGVQD